jgi:DHA2 family multidrug resistance protein
MSAAPPAPASFAPLTGGERVLGTLALASATFMNVLDSSIANVSIPAIAGDLGVSPSQGTWVITSFTVANAISVPLTGWLTQRFGQVRLFVASVLLFVLTSWLCGFAPNLETLIVFRVIQGLVAGPMIPLSQTLLLASYPRELAGVALSLWSMTTLIAPVVGPLLGGWITETISWPWIFYINVPVGLVAAMVTWSVYRKRDEGPRRVSLDVVGLALVIIWVGAFQMTIDLGKDLDWFGSTLIIVLATISAVGFVLFLAWELTEPSPIINLRLFGRRNFLAGTVALSLSYGLFFGNLVLLPLWLQQWMGYTATWAGLALAPVGVFALTLSPLVGRKIGLIDSRLLASIAFLLYGLVCWMRADFTVQTPFEVILVPTLIQGIAVAFFFVPLQAIIYNGLSPQEMPAAAGLSNFARISAGAFVTSIFGTVWEDRAKMHHAHLAESINSGNTALAQTRTDLTAQGLSSDQINAIINQMIDTQAHTLAADDLFYISSILYVSLIVIVWFASPRTIVHRPQVSAPKRPPGENDQADAKV